MLEKLQGAVGGQGDATDASSPEAEVKRKRILLIEDEPSTRLVLLQKLRATGFDVDVAVNGKVALEKIRTGHPDAIFMDLLLPRLKGLQGVDVIKAARRHPNFAGRPIYVCTSAALMTLWTRKGTKAGATKVFDRALTPIDAIVAEVAAELLGVGPGAKSPDSTSPDSGKLVAEPANPPPPDQQDNKESNGAQSPTQPLSFMKRVARTLGLGGKEIRSSGPSPATAQEPASPVPTTVASEPGGVSECAEAQLSAGGAATRLEDLGGSTDDGSLDGIEVAATEHGVAVLTLDENARILSANKTCASMFGWEGAEMVGQNLALLLKDGQQQDIEKLVQQQRAAEQSRVTCPLLTVARRKDGTEFPVSITTLTWSSDTALVRKAQSPQFCWTAFVRDMAAGEVSPSPATATPEQASQPQSAESMVLASEMAGLQERFAALQKGNEELQQQLQEITTEAALRHEDLTKREQEREDLTGRIYENEVHLNRARAELEKEGEERKQLEQKLQDLRAELDKQNQERERLEADWRERLRCADVLTEKLEARWLEEAGRSKGLEERLQVFSNSLKMEQAERSKRFEEEVLSLRKERDELYGKLSEEQLAAEEFRRRTEELETRLQDSAAEAERVKSELERQTAEQARLDSEWREKLSAAEALTSQLEAAWVHAEEHNKLTEAELTSLRQVRDELNAKLAGEHEAAAESGRRNEELVSRVIENSVALERVRAELQKAGRDEHFEAQLSGLEQAREELSGELKTGQQATAEARQRVEELENRLRENAAELERVKAEADRHAEEQARLESELQAKLDAANAAAGLAEAAYKDKAAQCSQFETQLANLEQLRDELGRKLAAEQESAAASKQRSEELEQRLTESAAELDQVKAEHQKQADERSRLEAELREQLEAARTAARQAEAALNEQAEQNKGYEERLQLFGNSIRLQQIENNERFENELTSLQQVRDELGGKLTAEQHASAEARRRSEELGNELRETAAELERVRAELSQRAEERTLLDSEQGERLNTARAAAEKAEAALAEHNKRFEQELADLREQRNQLNQRFTAEQQALAESRRQGNELESRLRETTGELERIHAELARYAEEQSRTESDQRHQIAAEKAATERAEAARFEETERRKRTEGELAALRQEREQIEQKFAAEQQAVAESRRHSVELEDRLSETVAEMARVRTELARYVEEREQLQAERAEQASQLNAARATIEKAEAALNEKTAHCQRSQEEAAGLWRECETLSDKLAAEQQAAADLRRRGEEFENRLRENAAELEAVKASQQQQAEEQKRLEADLREQLNHSQAAAARTEEALKDGAAHQRQLERSLVNLRNERHQVYDKFKAEHAALEKSKRRIGDLEKRLRQRATELEHAKSELEKQAAESGRQQSELRAQLETARTVAEREISLQRQEREAIRGELTCERQASAEFRKRSEEFESRLSESGAELERVKAELDEHARERNRLESEQQSFTVIKEALGRELLQLRESEVAQRADMVEMEGRLAENVALLSRVTTELEFERSERQRLERRAGSLTAEMQELHKELQEHLSAEQANEQRIAGLMDKLGQSEAAVTRISMDLQREMVNRQSAEEQLRATSEMSEQLRNHLSLLEEAKQVFAAREADLESRLQASLNAQQESASSAQKEAGERRRLEEALQETQRESQRQTDSNAAELSKLKSAMQVEQLHRKGLEAQTAQSRFTSLDSSRVGTAMVNNFRERLRQPIDKLMQSARRLLDAPLDEENKKLVESLLECALLLQTSVRESGTSNPGPLAEGRGGNPREPDDVRSLSPASSEAAGNLQP